MDALKLYTLNMALEFLHRPGIAPADTTTIKEYADFFHSYAASDKEEGKVVPFKPQGVN